jgi:hypothetical protein
MYWMASICFWPGCGLYITQKFYFSNT